MRYIVTKEIKSETQVFWWMYLQDLAFLVIWISLTLFLRNKVHGHLQIIYILFSVLIGVRLTLRSTMNPKRKYYQSLALYLLQSQHIYRYYKEEKTDGEAGERDSAHSRRNTYRQV